MRYIYLVSLILTINLLVLGCSRSDNNIPAGLNYGDFDNTFVYDSSSEYQSVLKKCISSTSESTSCKLSELPFLFQESPIPTKEMIMKRVVVSHEWMAVRFSQMLDILDDDIKILLGAVTAIVIDDDIIPSFYWSLTGAMYIDARYLWLSVEEANTITKKQDYRADFGNDLSFLEASRLLKDGEYASDYIPIDSNQTRTIDDIKYNMASLLYHELAHANDFLPSNKRLSLDIDKSVIETISSLANYRVTTNLYKSYPVQSYALILMGQVMYQGTTPTELQKETTAKEMGTNFESDGASDMYAYSSQYEDTATLFQMSMLKYHYGIEQDIGFLIAPTQTTNLSCSDYIIGWGERNSIAKPNVKERAIFVAQNILPNSDWTTIFENSLGSSQLLQADIDWCSALQINPSNKKLKQINLSNRPINPDDFKLKGDLPL
ncbi:MAG: hypothetical protein QM493_08970 [Sulfurovum sp.]